MTAPKTNLRTEKRRHRWPLIGMALAALFGVVIIVYWIMEEAYEGTPPQGADTQIDGRTGEPSTDPTPDVTPLDPDTTPGPTIPAEPDAPVEPTAPLENPVPTPDAPVDTPEPAEPAPTPSPPAE